MCIRDSSSSYGSGSSGGGLGQLTAGMMLGGMSSNNDFNFQSRNSSRAGTGSGPGSGGSGAFHRPTGAGGVDHQHGVSNGLSPQEIAISRIFGQQQQQQQGDQKQSPPYFGFSNPCTSSKATTKQQQQQQQLQLQLLTSRGTTPKAKGAGLQKQASSGTANLGGASEVFSILDNADHKASCTSK